VSRAGHSTVGAAPATGRSELPTDARLLPPLGDAFESVLDAALADLAESMAPDVRRALEVHARLLLAWNVAINLTAVRTPEGVALEHVADSLAALPLLRRLAGAGQRSASLSLLDLGSGPGYPGLPLALTLPAARAALVDSIGKKQRFLAVAARAAARELEDAGRTPPDIPDVAAVRARAEDLARSRHRQAWDVIVARAVGSLAEVAELALPLLRVGGHLVAWKREDGTSRLGRELAAARDVVEAAGGDGAAVEPVGVRGLEDHRLVIVGKARTTPARFPRAPAERRRPLLP
jgi:16S rRNA (guanine527-N7)-methyltransferase